MPIGSLHQEDSIRKPGERVHLAVPVRESNAGWPFAHHRRTQTDRKCEAIERHVYAVAEQTERVGGETVGELDDHEREVETGPIRSAWLVKREDFGRSYLMK